MIYKIIVDKQPRANPSSEKRTYTIDIEELRYLGEVKDTLVVGKGEDYVMRRLEISPFFVLKKLETPIKEPIEDLDVELFEGENYIYLEDISGSLLFAEYIIKNDFTDTYVTDAQMQSAIEISRGLIEISVDTKLNGYSTTTEMNAAINIKANEINSSVSNTYATKLENKNTLDSSQEYTNEQIITAKTEIKQTTDNISIEVSKKVGENEIISKINQSAESVGINANKIELSANDILNLLAGNTINLSSKNISISSTNFNVDKNGNMSCNNANIKGTIESSNGNVGGWEINSEGLSNGKVFIKNDGASTIYTVSDLIVMRGYIMGYTGFDLPPAMIKHYDFNGDGAVTASDYVTLQNLIGISMN